MRAWIVSLALLASCGQGPPAVEQVFPPGTQGVILYTLCKKPIATVFVVATTDKISVTTVSAFSPPEIYGELQQRVEKWKAQGGRFNVEELNPECQTT